VFDHIAPKPGDFDDKDGAVSEAMAGAWVRFAKTGSPNGENLPVWPAYKAPTYAYLEYGDVIATASGFRQAHIDFFKHAFEQMRATPSASAPDR
jgi:para-nitrobenzyl esterase